MSSTGYGRISSANRIPYYKGSTSRGRTYRGVKTGKMTADITNRLAKAQDTSMKNQYTDGLISSDQYNAYLSQRIAQTSDPTYRNTLTQELQNVVTGTNEANMLDGYKAGNVSAAEVASYYQSKLQGLTPDNPLYAKTQADIVKWNNTATTDSYKAQEAVLKSQEAGAANQLPAAQKLLDFYVQYLQKLTPNSPEYNSTVQAIGTYQAKVRQMTFQQSLLKAEDKISQTYNKNTPQDWNAKAQMYQQLRDAAAQQGDTTNFYKYDQLANNATDAAQKAQTAEYSKQISQAVSTVRENYISGKIDGATAQQQLQQIGTYADQYGDVSGSLLVHDLYNTIQSNIDHGVVYGGDNGYGKVKGGTGGGSQWFDAATNSPMGGGSSTSSSGSSSGGYSSGSSATPTSNSTNDTSASAKSSASGKTTPLNVNDANLLSELSNATQIANIQSNPTMMKGINNIAKSGGSVPDMIFFLRTQKVGTSDGWKALQDYQQQYEQNLLQQVNQGLITPQDFKNKMANETASLTHLYASWYTLSQQDPTYKINIDGTNTKIGTLTKKITDTVNGYVDSSGKQIPGLVQKTQIYSNPAYTPLFVQDKANPSQILDPIQAAALQATGELSKNYMMIGNNYYYVNKSSQIGGEFKTAKEALAFAKTQGYNNLTQADVKTNTDGTFSVFSGTPTQTSVQMAGPDGSIIKYTLDNGTPTSVSVNGKDMTQFMPGQILSPSDTINFVTKAQQTYLSNNPTLNTAKVANTANVSKVAGFSTPRANMNPANAASATLTNNLPNNSTSRFNIKSISSLTPNNPFAPVEHTVGNFLKGGVANVVNPNAANINAPLVMNPAVDQILAPVFNQIARPVDQLIQNIFKPSQVIKPVAIPQNTPLNATPAQQQTFSSPVTNSSAAGSNPAPQQQNPASPSAPLQVSGQQPQSPLQQSGIHVNLGSFPSANQQPAPAQNNWVSNIGNDIGGAVKNVESAAGNLWNSASSAASNFLGGFHF